uniref:Uncharacterized protein n=1 Tax=Rhizophora mucronata TaxID=61149 RepID=A0A2P2R4N3_RHIMU
MGVLYVQLKSTRPLSQPLRD